MSLPRPRLSTRGTAGYSFAELYLTRGPQAIGVTGDNSLPTLIGRVWALVLDADGRLRLFQRAETAATWTEQTTLLPPLFAETHPESRRRFSIAFDQGARANVAYEEDGVVYLTRWNPATSSYLQNVTVSGVDPVVVFDATWAYDVTVSDVLLFHLDAATRSRLLCRVQRDVYATAYELHDYGAPVVLDRVTRLPLRYQALASDEVGDPLEDEAVRVGLLSDLYPYPAVAAVVGEAIAPASGDYVRVVIIEYGADAVGAAATAPAGGTYAEPLLYYTGADDIGVTASPPASGDYAEPLLYYDADAQLDVTATAPTTSLYDLVVIEHGNPAEALDVSATGPSGGTYATP